MQGVATPGPGEWHYQTTLHQPDTAPMGFLLDTVGRTMLKSALRLMRMQMKLVSDPVLLRNAARRVDALGPGLGRNFRSYATGSYGYVRFVHDRVGSLKDAHSGVVGSLGLGVERTLNPHHALGLNAGGTWLSDDFTRRYGSAALEWRWHW